MNSHDTQLLAENSINSELQVSPRQKELELEIEELQNFLEAQYHVDFSQPMSNEMEQPDLTTYYADLNFTVIAKTQLIAVIIGGLMMIIASRLIYGC